MNSRRWIQMLAVALAAAGSTGTVVANDAELSAKSDDLNSNSAAQLGTVQSPTPQRKGDSSAQHGSDNAAAQMGSSVNANPGAQLSNDTQATSAPPADADSNAAEHRVKTGAQASEPHN